MVHFVKTILLKIALYSYKGIVMLAFQVLKAYEL